jgi:hypothetical protein
MFLTVTSVVLSALLQAPPQDKAALPLTLDFILTTSDGDAPGDLTPADVTLKVGGKVRPILNLELLPATTPHQIVLIVDEPTLYNLEKPAKDAIHKLLATVRPGDRVTYMSTRGGRAEPGKDAAAKAADAMVTGPGVLYSCLDDLMTMIERAAKTMPKGRMGFLAVIARGHPDGPTLDRDAAGGCTPHRDATRKTEEVIAASQVNLQLFTVSETNSSWGLDTLASNIGGRTGLITFANTNALERALNENRRHYRATIAADPSAPERPQRVDLKVAKKNVKVRTSATLVINPQHVGTR